MPYFRKPKDSENPYSLIHNELLEDPDLSFRAKGLLCYLLSKSDDWKVYQAQLKNVGLDGEDAVRSAMEELKANGYIHRFQTREPDGSFGPYLYLVFEEPRFNVDPTETGFTEIGETETGFPDLAKPRFAYTNKDSNQDGNNQDGARDAPAGARKSAPCSVDEAVQIGSEENIPPKVCRKWWHFYNSRGWPHRVENVRSALIVWNDREQKLHSNGSGAASFNAESVEDLRGETFTEKEIEPLIDRFDALEREDFGFARMDRDDTPLYSLVE